MSSAFTVAGNQTTTPALANDQRFADLMKKVTSEGAKVAAAHRANQKAEDSRPNVAADIVRNSRPGEVLQEETIMDQMSAIHRAYTKATGNPNETAGSVKAQVAKWNRFFYLGSHPHFNGEQAFDKFVRLFEETQEKNAKLKDKKARVRLNNKFEAYYAAAKLLLDAANKEIPQRYFREDDSDTSDWRPDEVTDSEIIDAMRAPDPASKSAKAELESIAKRLRKLIDGKGKDKDGERIIDDSQEIVQALALIDTRVSVLTLNAERERIIDMARKAGVSLAEASNAISPKPRAGRKRSQKRG